MAPPSSQRPGAIAPPLATTLNGWHKKFDPMRNYRGLVTIASESRLSIIRLTIAYSISTTAEVLDEPSKWGKNVNHSTRKLL